MYPDVPPPEDRIAASTYLEARAWLLANDEDAQRMRDWSERVRYPRDPDHTAHEIIWIILCAGRSAQSARTIENKVMAAIRGGRPIVEAFGYRAKAEAMEDAWKRRAELYGELVAVLASGDQEAVVDWCGAIRYVGDDTKFQLAKNFGADVCKPDIWLSRLTGFPDRPRLAVRRRFPACMALCRHLGAAAGDKVATVDSLLWLACNKGVLKVSPEAGPVTFDAKRITARSIYTAA